MSKDLEAFGLIKRTCELYMESTRFLKGSDIIANQIKEALNIIRNRLESIDNANHSEALKCLEALEQDIKDRVILAEDRQLKLCAVIKQALQRLNRYEQILSSGRLTDRNYKNTTLDSDSCKPYLRLGQLEDIYEEVKKE